MDELEVKRDAPRSDVYLSGLTETLTDELGGARRRGGRLKRCIHGPGCSPVLGEADRACALRAEHGIGQL